MRFALLLVKMAIHLSIMSYAGRVNRDLAGIPHIVECDIDTPDKGYVLYSNLLLMQWAKYSTGTNGEKTVKFAKPFANTNYFVTNSNTGNIGSGHDYEATRISDAQTVWLKSPGTTGWLIAIGKAKS